MTKPLIFTDYLVQQALWLQRQIDTDIQNTDYLPILYVGFYVCYLEICGADKSLLASIAKLLPILEGTYVYATSPTDNSDYIKANYKAIIDFKVKTHYSI